MTEPWPLVTEAISSRVVPDDILARLRTMSDAVEELSDGLRGLGIESGVDLGDWCANRTEIRHVGPILTMRYAPKTICDDDMRLGNAQLAPLVPAGAIIVEDARGCGGCVLGGRAAGMLSRAGAAVAIIDGMARDPVECDSANLAVIAAQFGIQSGRSTLQAIEIGGRVVLRNRFISSGDLGVVNRNGLVSIPAWVPWEEIRSLIGLA